MGVVGGEAVMDDGATIAVDGADVGHRVGTTLRTGQRRSCLTQWSALRRSRFAPGTPGCWPCARFVLRASRRDSGRFLRVTIGSVDGGFDDGRIGGQKLSPCAPPSNDVSQLRPRGKDDAHGRGRVDVRLNLLHGYCAIDR